MFKCAWHMRIWLISDWIKLLWSYTIQRSYFMSFVAKQVCFGPVKTRNMYRFFWEKYNYSLLSATTFRNLQQPDLLQDRFDSFLLKCAISLFNSFYSNVVNQVARFCWPFYRPLNKTKLQFAAKTKPSFLNTASFSKIFFELNHFSVDKDPLSKGIFTRTKIEINL